MELPSHVRPNRAIHGCHPVLGQQCMTISTRARAFAEQIFLLHLKYEMDRGLPCIHCQAAYESARKRRAMKESCSKCDLPFPPLSNAKGSLSSIHSRIAPYQRCSFNYKSTDARLGLWQFSVRGTDPAVQTNWSTSSFSRNWFWTTSSWKKNWWKFDSLIVSISNRHQFFFWVNWWTSSVHVNWTDVTSSVSQNWDGTVTGLCKVYQHSRRLMHGEQYRKYTRTERFRSDKKEWLLFTDALSTPWHSPPYCSVLLFSFRFSYFSRHIWICGRRAHFFWASFFCHSLRSCAEEKNALDNDVTLRQGLWI